MFCTVIKIVNNRDRIFFDTKVDCSFQLHICFGSKLEHTRGNQTWARIRTSPAAEVEQSMSLPGTERITVSLLSTCEQSVVWTIVTAFTSWEWGFQDPLLPQDEAPQFSREAGLSSLSPPTTEFWDSPLGLVKWTLSAWVGLECPESKKRDSCDRKLRLRDGLRLWLDAMTGCWDCCCVDTEQRVSVLGLNTPAELARDL